MLPANTLARNQADEQQPGLSIILNITLSQEVAEAGNLALLFVPDTPVQFAASGGQTAGLVDKVSASRSGGGCHFRQGNYWMLLIHSGYSDFSGTE